MFRFCFDRIFGFYEYMTNKNSAQVILQFITCFGYIHNNLYMRLFGKIFCVAGVVAACDSLFDVDTFYGFALHWILKGTRLNFCVYAHSRLIHRKYNSSKLQIVFVSAMKCTRDELVLR